MKAVIKILSALATIAGIVYIAATYGDQIVAWAKKVLAAMPCPKCQEAEAEITEEAPVEAPAEEAPAAEAEAQEVPAEEAPAEEVVVEEHEPVAEETDFEA